VHLEQFIRSLQVRLEGNIVNQTLAVVKQWFLLDGFRLLAFAWGLDRLARGLGQLYALVVTCVNKRKTQDI
jgi:hypothetical protein